MTPLPIESPDTPATALVPKPKAKPKPSKPKPPVTKSKPLEVRRFYWRPRIEGPPMEYYAGKKWHPCECYDDARTYAEDHGYPGIQIRPSVVRSSRASSAPVKRSQEAS